MTPSRRALQAILETCGITLNPHQYDLLWAYHGMLRAANPDLNLTRIHNFENMVLKHYADSLLVLRFTELPSPLIDMGTGPGLPGIPLKIARPDVQMTLAEPRGARVEFLNDVVLRLGLKHVDVLGSKIGPRSTRKVAGIITRAVASIPETLDKVANSLLPGARMLFMKGPECDDEIRDARTSHAESFREFADHAYQIPYTTHNRRLLIYERIGCDHSVVSVATRFEGEVREVSSASNPTFKLCRDLLTGKGIRRQGQALIAGARQVEEVLQRFPDRAEGWVTDAEGVAPPIPLRWFRVADPLFRELDVSGTHAPLLIVKVPDPPEWSEAAPWPTGCTLFVPFQDPENVGAVIRSAAAFGVTRVVLLKEAAHPFHPKSARAAGPSLFQVELQQGPSLQNLRTTLQPLIALATDGPDLATLAFPETFGMVAGLEGPGLPDHLREGPRRRVPIAPGVESLNAATATAVALYVWSQGRSNPSVPTESSD